MRKKNLLLILLLFSISAGIQAINPADKIVGTYSLTEPETGTASKVRIYKLTDGTYQGQVVWISVDRDKNGNLFLDVNNPNEKLRSVPCNQVIMLRNFKYDAAKDQWIDGEIYNPANGKTYKSYMTFENDTKLKVRGYIGTPALGKSIYWTKIK